MSNTLETSAAADPLRLSAMEMAQALRDRRLRSRQLVDAHIARIERVNPRINAMVQFRFDDARAEADAADSRLAEGSDSAELPPLLGVPCSIKENFAFPGFPQVSGLVARRDAIAREEAPTVTRLRAAGAIVLGFTNTPELCMWMETFNRVYGRTNNPYDPKRIAGGSSGGEGSLIGAGASPFGLGADVGGSIRLPAFFNGVFGHKPTPGIVPNTGQVPLPQGQMNYNCVTGPLARRGGDLWPLLGILAGADGRDPACRDGALVGHPARVRLQDLHVLDIAWDGRRRVDPELAASQRAAAHWLREQGARVSRPQPALLKRAFEIWSAMMKATQPEPFAEQLGQGQRIPLLQEILRLPLKRTPHTVPALGLAALETLGGSLSRYEAQADELRGELLELLGDDGVILYPPYTRPAPRHDRPLLRPFDFAYCGLINVLGLPSTQVPLGLGREGLPLGVQVVGAPGQDARTIAVACALERAFGGWRPPPDMDAR